MRFKDCRIIDKHEKSATRRNKFRRVAFEIYNKYILIVPKILQSLNLTNHSSDNFQYKITEKTPIILILIHFIISKKLPLVEITFSYSISLQKILNFAFYHQPIHQA